VDFFADPNAVEATSMQPETESKGGLGLSSLGSILHRLNPFIHTEKKPETPPQFEPDPYDELRAAIARTFVLEKSRQSFK